MHAKVATRSKYIDNKCNAFVQEQSGTNSNCSPK